MKVRIGRKDEHGFKFWGVAKAMVRDLPLESVEFL